MSSKHWIEKAIKKPGIIKAQAPPDDSSGKTGKRARLAEMLLHMRKEKG
jgi:hypothetical protein